MQECYEQMELMQVSTAEIRIKKVLSGLGFSDGLGAEGVDSVNMMSMPTRLLSGGWVMRASWVCVCILCVQ